jgi:hypothetical protein
MKPFSSPDDSFSLLNAELSDKQFMRRTDFKKLVLPPERLEIKRDRL